MALSISFTYPFTPQQAVVTGDRGFPPNHCFVQLAHRG
ncbi:Uncharacterised protein [Vibrio cholerae]|nr:Uncharacterised protein [Vibrio cholerae]